MVWQNNKGPKGKGSKLAKRVCRCWVEGLSGLGEELVAKGERAVEDGDVALGEEACDEEIHTEAFEAGAEVALDFITQGGSEGAGGEGGSGWIDRFDKDHIHE